MFKEEDKVGRQGVRQGNLIQHQKEGVIKSQKDSEGPEMRVTEGMRPVRNGYPV